MLIVAAGAVLAQALILLLPPNFWETSWHRQTDGHTHKKKANTVVNSVPPDTEYLYYPLNVEGITLKGSFLSTKKKKD